MIESNKQRLQEMQTMCQSFNELAWHDSKLRAIHIQHRGDVDDVVVEVELREADGSNLTPTKVVLEDVAFVFCDLDLQGKSQASDDISSAKCSVESTLKQKIQDERLKFSPDVLSTYVHFNFYLVPPFGSLDVIASGYRVS